MRLVKPTHASAVDLVFFPLDSTKKLAGTGMREYRDALQQLAEGSTSAQQVIGIALFKFQDALEALTKPAAPDEHPILATIRASYPGPVHHITLAQAAAVYEGCTERDLQGNVKDERFRSDIDFLNMHGAITHSNCPALEEMVVLDSIWLWKVLTRVVGSPAPSCTPV